MNLLVIYNEICKRGQVRYLDTYTEKHHIIPKCMGGKNDKDNLTTLTAKEHFIVHKILCILHPNSEKLKYAFWAMCNQTKNRNYIVSGRDYEYAKKLLLPIWTKKKSKETKEKISKGKKGKKININQEGNLNHNFGKIWIKNVSSSEEKMIKLGDIIPDGWQRGRFKSGSLGKSQISGKSWYHNLSGEEKYFSKEDIIPDEWIIGRYKNNMVSNNNLLGKICYHNTYLKKEKYFNNSDSIPDGWIIGRLSKKKWFYNPATKIEKLFNDGEQEENFIRGRLPKFTI